MIKFCKFGSEGYFLNLFGRNALASLKLGYINVCDSNLIEVGLVASYGFWHIPYINGILNYKKLGKGLFLFT